MKAGASETPASDLKSKEQFFECDCIIFFLKILFIYFYREGKGRRKKGRQMSVCKRYVDWLPLLCPQLGTWLATQACALTGNQTGDLLVNRQVLSPLSHISQGRMCLYNPV